MKYRALGPINHDNVPYKPGDAIELSSDEAKPLLEAGAVEAFSKPFAPATSGANEGGEV